MRHREASWALGIRGQKGGVSERQGCHAAEQKDPISDKVVWDKVAFGACPFEGTVDHGLTHGNRGTM